MSNDELAVDNLNLKETDNNDDKKFLSHVNQAIDYF